MNQPPVKVHTLFSALGSAAGTADARGVTATYPTGTNSVSGTTRPRWWIEADSDPTAGAGTCSFQAYGSMDGITWVTTGTPITEAAFAAAAIGSAYVVDDNSRAKYPFLRMDMTAAAGGAATVTFTVRVLP